MSKNIIDPNLETPKYIATKSRETNVRDRALYHHANSHADQRENWAEMYHLCPRAKTARQRIAQQALANELAWRKDQLGCNLRMLRWR